MKIAIRYYSKTGNTEKLANAISQVTGVSAKTTQYPVDGPVDVLFLGSSVYAAGIDQEVKEFIKTLNKKNVRKVVNFSTAALLTSTYKQVRQLIEKQGISMEENEFHCRGQFKVMHKGRPDEKDLTAVQQFAKAIVGKR